MRASDRREGSPGGTLQLLVPFAGKAEMGGERRRGSGLLAVLHGFGVDGEAEETEEERDDDSEDVDVIQQPRNGKVRQMRRGGVRHGPAEAIYFRERCPIFTRRGGGDRGMPPD